MSSSDQQSWYAPLRVDAELYKILHLTLGGVFMSNRTSNHTLNQRLVAVVKVLERKHSLSGVARELGIARTTLRRWIVNYQNNGVAGLKESHTCRRYPTDLKRAAVLDYLDNHYSQLECCRKYNISSRSLLMRWVNQYTNGKTLKKITGGSTKMKTPRKLLTINGWKLSTSRLPMIRTTKQRWGSMVFPTARFIAGFGNMNVTVEKHSLIIADIKCKNRLWLS